MGNAAILARAFDYPYRHADCAFIFRKGQARRLGNYSAQAMIDAGFTPVLGVGSNCAPDQLARKFSGYEGVWDPVDRHSLFVVPARLADFDVVYAASIAGYGSIPATLQGSPGTLASICVTFLGERELARMHQTEAVGTAYDFVRMSGIELALSNGEVLREAWTYMGRQGCLLVEGENVALTAMRAEGRRFTSLTQREVLEHVHLDYDKGKHATLEEFVLSLIGPENATRREVLYYNFTKNEFDPGNVSISEENPFD